MLPEPDDAVADIVSMPLIVPKEPSRWRTISRSISSGDDDG